MSASAVLGVDFGTSHTVAVLRRENGAATPLLFDGSPLLPSAVYAEPTGELVCGRDALHSARLNPERFEPNPKRRVDDGTVLLGDTEIEVTRLFAAVLGRVRAEAERVAGALPSRTVLTHPAVWGPARRLVLTDACRLAGFGAVTLMPEPVAAARHFTGEPGIEVVPGNAVVVCDFGGGTFDASVVAATPAGFEVLTVDGSDRLGGVDIDHGIVDHIGRRFDGDDRWDALMGGDDTSSRRHRRTFLDDVRAAKERLSRHNRVDLLVPIVDVDAHLTRDELEAITEPLLRQASRLTDAVLRSAEVPRERIAGVYLVGGASRMPLVATTLHRDTGIAPTVIDQPELVVAAGATIDMAAVPVTPPAPMRATVTPPFAVPPPRTELLPTTSPDQITPSHPLPAPPLSFAPNRPLGEASAPGNGTATTRRFRVTLIVLLWTQFALLFAESVCAPIAMVMIEPPMYIWIAMGPLAPMLVALAWFTGSNALRVTRNVNWSAPPVRLSQWLTLVHASASVLLIVLSGGPYIIGIRAAISAIVIIAVVIIGLVQLGLPSRPVTASRIARSVRVTTMVQLGQLAVVAVISLMWWSDVLAYNDFQSSPTSEDALIALLGAVVVLPVVAAVLVIGAFGTFSGRPISTATANLLRGCQVALLAVAFLYVIPWFSNEGHRLMPVDIGEYELRTEWMYGGEFDALNEFALWMVVTAAAPAILIIVQLAAKPLEVVSGMSDRRRAADTRVRVG